MQEKFFKVNHGGVEVNKIYSHDGMWMQFSALEFKPETREIGYKLHIGVNLNHYDLVSRQLKRRLLKAVIRGDISYFKAINYNQEQMHQFLSKAQEHGNTKVIRSQERLYNNQITIYLPDDVTNLNKIIALCNELEDMIAELPSSHEFLSIADLALTEHISFRRENNPSGVYVFAVEEDHKLLELKKLALMSEWYLTLWNNLNIKQEVIPKNLCLFSNQEHNLERNNPLENLYLQSTLNN